MAFSKTNEKGTVYYLHGRQTTLKNGTKQTIYFFAKEIKEGAMDELPAGYEVALTKNGLPVLKKAGGGDKAAAEKAPAKKGKK